MIDSEEWRIKSEEWQVGWMGEGVQNLFGTFTPIYELASIDLAQIYIECYSFIVGGELVAISLILKLYIHES